MILLRTKIKCRRGQCRCRGRLSGRAAPLAWRSLSESILIGFVSSSGKGTAICPRVFVCVCLCFFICLCMGVYACLICVFVFVFLFVCLYLFMFTSLCVCAWVCMFDHISKHCEKGRRRRRSITESIPVLLLKCSFIDFPPSPTHSPNPNPTQPHPTPPIPTQPHPIPLREGNVQPSQRLL